MGGVPFNIIPSKFPLGQIVATAAVSPALQGQEEFMRVVLSRHAWGDWGELDAHDWQMNDTILREGQYAQLLSTWTIPEGRKIYIITDAPRQVTTVMYPEDY